MPFDAFRFKVFSRRVFIIAGLQGALFFIIIARLFKFQILDYSYFKDRSDGNRIKQKIIPPLRGLILDRENRIIASNAEYFRIILKKVNYKSDLNIIEKLAKVLNFKEDGKKALILEYNRNRIQKEIIIYRYLTRKELIAVEFNLHLLKNISVGVGNARIYSNSFSFSNLIGYVIQVPSSEAKSKKYIQHPDIKIGAEGLEKIYDNDLLGKAGMQYYEVNAAGFKIADLESFTPVNGKDLNFSFNARLQNFAFELCKNKKASVVLMDITTGEILAMLSSPSFDINLLSKKIDTETWNSMLNDPQKPLINRPIQSAYAPGSIFKLISALVALENGYDFNQKIQCTGSTYIYGTQRRCWLKTGHGKLDLRNAIKHSCNMTFYNIGVHYSVSDFHKMASEFGVGEIFKNFEFTNQIKGINPSNVWKKEFTGESWYPGDTINLSIGQGFIKMTSLQLAVLLSRLASLGKRIEPTMQFKTEIPNFEEINVNKEHLKFVKSALFEATNSPGGTSYFSRIREKGLEFSGKTGTAQVVSKFLEKHEYTDVTRPHAIFAGFAPFENSKFAASVIIENGGFGSSAAAPIGKNLLLFAQLLNLERTEDAKKLTNSLGINFSKL
jgi:penicillin-binding protein 2